MPLQTFSFLAASCFGSHSDCVSGIAILPKKRLRRGWSMMLPSLLRRCPFVVALRFAEFCVCDSMWLDPLIESDLEVRIPASIEEVEYTGRTGFIWYTSCGRDATLQCLEEWSRDVCCQKCPRIGNTPLRLTVGQTYKSIAIYAHIRAKHVIMHDAMPCVDLQRRSLQHRLTFQTDKSAGVAVSSLSSCNGNYTPISIFSYSFCIVPLLTRISLSTGG